MEVRRGFHCMSALAFDTELGDGPQQATLAAGCAKILAPIGVTGAVVLAGLRSELLYYDSRWG